MSRRLVCTLIATACLGFVILLAQAQEAESGLADSKRAGASASDLCDALDAVSSEASQGMLLAAPKSARSRTLVLPEFPEDKAGLFCYAKSPKHGRKYLIGPASGTVKLPEDMPVTLLLPSDEHTAIATLQAMVGVKINSLQIPPGCANDRVLKAALVVSCPEVIICDANVSAATIALLKKLSPTSVRFVNCHAADEQTLSDITTVSGLKRIGLVGMFIPERLFVALHKLSDLQDIELDDSTFGRSGLKYLSALKQLRSVSLVNTNLSEASCRDLANLGSLTSLRIGKNPEVDDSSVSHLRALSQLQYLDLRATKITKRCLPPLKNMHNLLALDLSYTALDDSCIPTLASMKLANLNLSGTNVTDDGAHQLNECKGLKRLLLEDTDVSDDMVSNLKLAHTDAEIH